MGLPYRLLLFETTECACVWAWAPTSTTRLDICRDWIARQIKEGDGISRHFRCPLRPWSLFALCALSAFLPFVPLGRFCPLCPQSFLCPFALRSFGPFFTFLPFCPLCPFDFFALFAAKTLKGAKGKRPLGQKGREGSKGTKGKTALRARPLRP